MSDEIWDVAIVGGSVAGVYSAWRLLTEGGGDPFGGGWKSWNIGVQSCEVKRQILNPVKGVPVYICGEAYSDAQGWVGGALQTTDMLLRN
jgi:hypothetical protein